MIEKGFTLIELLAVLVIISLVALVATPIVIGIVNKAQKEAFKASIYGVIEAGELYYIENMMQGTDITDMTFVFPDVSDLKIKGTIPSTGLMVLYANGKVSILASNGKWCAIKVANEDTVSISDDIEDCSIEGGIASISPNYKEEILNGADPEIGKGMIPVNISSDGVVTKADIKKEWYRYEQQRWANVVLLDKGVRDTYGNGDVITEDKILAYLVWIPRYRYQLWNVDGNNTSSKTLPLRIEIKFENSTTPMSTGISNDDWLTHPAFCFGRYDEENGICTGDKINGYWVGKFESGYRQSDDLTTTDTWTKDGAKYSYADSSKILIKPNINSWRNISISNIFNMIRGMSNNDIFGLDASSDTHLMKNMEWGAVAYLSHSAFGINKQIRINNNSNYKTGCSASADDKDLTPSCEIEYASAVEQLSSTTGNITGIYDMSGGSREYVMGYTVAASKKYGSSGFIDASFPTDKYYDEYSSTGNNNFADGKLGDATKEMGPFTSNIGSWYKDYSSFLTDSWPWFHRGDNIGNRSDAGIFYFNSYDGSGHANYSFRVVALVK